MDTCILLTAVPEIADTASAHNKMAGQTQVMAGGNFTDVTLSKLVPNFPNIQRGQTRDKPT